MEVVFFVLSFAAVLVLFGSIIASLAWLIIGTLRVLLRLLAKLRPANDGRSVAIDLTPVSALSKDPSGPIE